jgi:uncharacterized protein DUF4350
VRRIDPLYALAAVLFLVTLAVLVVTTSSGPTSTATSRSASVYDDGPGGAGTLRRFLTAMGASTTTIQGETFSISPETRVVLILGAVEAISDNDGQRLDAFVRAGGTVVLATDVGFLERGALDAFGVRIGGFATPGTHSLAGAAFADPPARSIHIDRGISLGAAPRAAVLADDGRSPLIVATKVGNGLFVAVGSVGPFLGSGLGEADNGRLVLNLVRPALAGGIVAFDEYHHGLHPSNDILVLVQNTWPGRALAFAVVATFLYLILSGRRIGPAVPLAVRPARSSLEYIRGFAGLVRRSGRGEIARRRLRADLQKGLARAFGLDPATPFERVLVTVASSDRERAARAQAIDDALRSPLREDELLRTVGHIENVIAAPHGS